MKKIYLIALIAAVISSCSSRQETQVAPDLNSSETFVAAQVRDKIILDYLKTKGEFHWSWATTSMLYSAVVDDNDSTLTVGYQPTNFQNINTRMHEIDVKSAEWVKAKNDIVASMQQVYAKHGITKTREQIVRQEHDVLPYFKVKVEGEAIVEALRKSPNVRYAEPATYYLNTNADGTPANHRVTSAGCGSGSGGSVPSSDYTRTSPDNAIVSWHLNSNRIAQAWAVSGKGRNINIGIIDTGTSPNQAKLGSQFNRGQSTGRTLRRYGTFAPRTWKFWQKRKIDGPNDDCGHGTSMAGVAVAPRTSDGNATGVAYQSNFYSVRGTDDVVLNAWDEQDGVSDALVLLAKKNTHIISMSLGNLWWVGQIADAIRYANGKGKLIFSAAGTSFSWGKYIVGVIFPATMSETVAVTGIKDNGYNPCYNCHYGKKVDFTMVMQRASSNSRTALTLPMSGNSLDRVGGSSVATATTAGVAALIWSTNPSLSRAQVLQKMKSNSDFYPGRNSKFGWGKINVYNAVLSAKR